jgi:hypothetical protein
MQWQSAKLKDGKVLRLVGSGPVGGDAPAEPKEGGKKSKKARSAAGKKEEKMGWKPKQPAKTEEEPAS